MGGELSILRLDGGGETMLLALRAGPPAMAYWGPTLGAVDPAQVETLLDRQVPGGMLDNGEALDLFPEAARGFTGHPAIEAHRPGGAFLTQLSLVQHRAIDEGHAILLRDETAGIEVALRITVDPGAGVAAFRSRLANTGHEPLSVGWLAPCALPMLHDEVMVFDGRWAWEFQDVRERVGSGLWLKDNRTGRTSHHAPPFAVVGSEGFRQQSGEVVGLHLGWSGNHRLLVERIRDGRLQAQAGELFLPGEMTLAPGQAYATPVLYAARSTTGLNGLSDRFHPFVRDRILAGRLKDKPRPVNFNTWEAVYFRHDVAELKSLAELAADVGAERFVLDDGWFAGRNDDTTSLGDWRADPAKYPDGLGPLIDYVRGLGMEFGLWVEPEMANAESELLRAHPDWTLHAEGRDQPLGRGQYVLDLTRREVADNIFGQLDALLTAHPIGYLKWDMNRDLTHAASGGLPAAHRQTQAAYALIDRLRTAHPDIEIESCASGGGRADFEILRRTDRIWTSDCNDPLDRQRIQRGFSIFFPPEVMGAHVSAAQSHTTGRRASLVTRAFTALFGHMGIEADIRDFTEADLRRLTEVIGLYKRWRGMLHAGRTLRLDLDDPGAVAFAVLGDDAALVSFAQLETPRRAAPAPLRVPGLDGDAEYRIRMLTPPAREQRGRRPPALLSGEAHIARGALIAGMGITPPNLSAGGVAIFLLERIR